MYVSTPQGAEEEDELGPALRSCHEFLQSAGGHWRARKESTFLCLLSIALAWSSLRSRVDGV